MKGGIWGVMGIRYACTSKIRYLTNTKTEIIEYVDINGKMI